MSHPITGNNGVVPVIREYICVKPYPKSFKFPDIDYNKIDFHVILGFAHEHYNQNGKGTGKFYADWDLDICGIKSVKEIKENYPNVKVIISIGGRDFDNHKYPFNPIEIKSWVDNAVDSLKTIIFQNNVDGIDIDYEHFKTNENEFCYYIGEVITRLKDAKVIDVVSIAPSHETDKYYQPLYKACSDYINWVDYQFYRQPIPTENDFINRFYDASNEYDPKKLLAGASTDPRDAGNISLIIYEKIIDLVNRKIVRGIFIWNANDLEKIALPNRLYVAGN